MADRVAISYENKAILAPMVRAGTLPLRMLARKYGADICYGEEIIDKSIVACERRETPHLGCVDFVRDNRVVFRTCPAEETCVFQMGTADAVTALRAAQMVCRDVSAVDVNMGCPKHFSLSGGMGAALLDKPEVVHDILTTLVRNMDVPVTCKIRVKPQMQDTLDFVKMCESTGIKAIAVHGRQKEERDKHAVRFDEVRSIVEAGRTIPVIHNGDVLKYEDIAIVREKTQASSVMIARGALWNASVFNPVRETTETVQREYVRASVDWESVCPNIKYTLTRMIDEKENREQMQSIRKCHSTLDVCRLYGLEEYYAEHKRRVQQEGDRGNISSGRKREAEDEAAGAASKRPCVRGDGADAAEGT